jgi:hypothetical protein
MGKENFTSNPLIKHHNPTLWFIDITKTQRKIHAILTLNSLHKKGILPNVSCIIFPYPLQFFQSVT